MTTTKAKPSITLVKQQVRRTAPKRTRKPAAVKERPKTKTGSNSSKLSQILTPKNIQESVKTVTNLRSMVKNWLQYLNQADQVLDTLFVTSNSLRESGVLDKLIKQKGKNLTTEDFTNVLIALMNSPIGGQFLKGGGDAKEAKDGKPSS